MYFEFDYNDQKFWIQLEHIYKPKDKTEVFSLVYSGNRDDADQYEIKLYQIDSGRLEPVKVTEQPKELQEAMGEFLKNAMPKSFFANPYFDEVMIFFGSTVITSKDRFIPISCNQCERKDLYEKKGKNKTDYITEIQNRLRQNPNPAWPFKGKLHIQFSVSDKQSRLNEIDVDNLAKTILDSLQGVVFENDSQIDMLVASKDFINGFIANIIAIKELQSGERPKYQEFLFSGRFKHWREEYNQKEAEGKSTRFSIIN